VPTNSGTCTLESYFEWVEKSTSWDLLDFTEEGITVVEDISNEDLLASYRHACAELSYFNAAEGGDWGRERDARNSTYSKWLKLKEMLMERGIYSEELNHGFLV
jgi:hypothetical protein